MALPAMSRRSTKYAGVCLLLLVAGGCGGDTSPPDGSKRPSILLITIDTLRADHLGCYGYYRQTSPRMDRLAAQSLLFERAYAPVATTLPSHLSLLTGVYPLEHGVLANIKHSGMKFEAYRGLRSLALFAGELGYETAAFVSAAPLKRSTGIDEGFQTFQQPEEPSAIAEIARAGAGNWLGQRSGEHPFFLWVHLFDPHRDYEPPGEYAKAFAEEPGLDRYFKERGLPDKLNTFEGLLDLRDQINRYDGEILYTDFQIGLLLDRLDELGFEEETIVVIVGDHGEGLGQHGELGHGCVHDEQLRIPLMIRIPGRNPEKVSTPTAIVDVFPTLLGEWDPLPWSLFLAQASGVNVLAGGHQPRAVFGQRTMRSRGNLHPFAFTLTGPRWKYIHEPEGEAHLFDLSADPFESHDLVGTESVVAAGQHELLLAMVEAQRARGQAFAGEEGISPEMDEKLLEELRALGYVH